MPTASRLGDAAARRPGDRARPRRPARLRRGAHRAGPGARAARRARRRGHRDRRPEPRDVRFRGEAGHAGTVPMDARRDALAAAAEWVLAVEAAGRPGLVATVGRLDVEPGARNVIPGAATVTLDVRHADDGERRGAVARSARPRGERDRQRAAASSVEWADTADIPAVAMDERLTARLGEGLRPAAQRRRPRRRDDGLDHARRDAVRALPRRHQPQPGRVGRGGRRGGRRSTSSSGSSMPSDLLIRGGTVVLPGVFPIRPTSPSRTERSRPSARSCRATRARRSTRAACTCSPAWSTRTCTSTSPAGPTGRAGRPARGRWRPAARPRASRCR